MNVGNVYAKIRNIQRFLQSQYTGIENENFRDSI